MSQLRSKRPTLYPVEGCGHCADIVAASLLTGCDVRFYDMLEAHLVDHVSRPSIWDRLEWRPA